MAFFSGCGLAMLVADRHGTRCAGEVAAEANNGICSVGVAFESSIGGMQLTCWSL